MSSPSSFCPWFPHGLCQSVFLCLYLSVPLEGDSGSPLWLTTQSVTLCLPAQLEAPLLSTQPKPSAPGPLGLQAFVSKAASPFFLSFTYLSLAQSPSPISLQPRPFSPWALSSPIHLSSLKLSSLCPPICHHQHWAYSPLGHTRLAFLPLGSVPSLPSSFSPSRNPTSSVSFHKLLSQDLLPHFSLESQLSSLSDHSSLVSWGESADSRVPAPNP